MAVPRKNKVILDLEDLIQMDVAQGRFRTTSLDSVMSGLARSFLADTRLAAFGFARVFDDKTCIINCTEKAIPSLLFRTGSSIASSIPSGLTQDKIWYVLSSGESPEPVLEYYRDRYSVGSVLYFVDRHPGYFDVFSFASPQSYQIATNDFLNQKEELEKFSRDFIGRIEGALALDSIERIQIPAETETKPEAPPVAFTPSWHSSQIQGFLSEVFTQRERDCLRYLFLGATAKDIAQDLKLSPRTIECYLENIKTKLGCSKKSKIVSSILARASQPRVD